MNEQQFKRGARWGGDVHFWHNFFLYIFEILWFFIFIHKNCQKKSKNVGEKLLKKLHSYF